MSTVGLQKHERLVLAQHNRLEMERPNPCEVRPDPVAFSRHGDSLIFTLWIYRPVPMSDDHEYFKNQRSEINEEPQPPWWR